MRNLENIFNLGEADLRLVSDNSECSGKKNHRKKNLHGTPSGLKDIAFFLWPRSWRRPNKTGPE